MLGVLPQQREPWQEFAFRLVPARVLPLLQTSQP